MGGVENVEACLDGLEGRVTADMNNSQLKPFLEEEVRAALFQMGPLKASGPDGLMVAFLRRIGMLWALRFVKLPLNASIVVL